MKLIETNWHRLLTLYKPTGFCILSACRHENTAEENEIATRKLKAELNNFGFKAIPVSGGWIENKGTSKEREVAEDSFFVPFFIGDRHFSASQYDTEATFTLYKKCKQLGTQFKQESILYCPPNGKPRYIQTTEKDYNDGNGPVAIGTTTMKFDDEHINVRGAEYFTDISNPKKEGGYDYEKKRFKKAPRRLTFESKGVTMNYARIFEATKRVPKVTGPYCLSINSHNKSVVASFLKEHKEYKPLIDFVDVSCWKRCYFGPKDVLEDIASFIKSENSYASAEITEYTYVPPKEYPEGTKFSLGIAIEPGKSISEEYYKWERAMEHQVEKNTLPRATLRVYNWCREHGTEFKGLLNLDRDVPRHEEFKRIADLGFEPWANWLEKHPMPPIFDDPNAVVEEKEEPLLFALFSDGGNAYSSRDDANWYWTTNESEYEDGRMPRARLSKVARNMGIRHAERNYREYDPRAIQVKIFTSVDAFIKAANKVGLHPNVDEYKN